jgi:hypothetical protein
MRWAGSSISLLVVGSALAAASAEGQTASQVVDRYVELIGGRAAIDEIHTLGYERVLTHMEEDRIITNRVYHRRPGRYRIETESGVLIVNGDAAWWGCAILWERRNGLSRMFRVVRRLRR